MIKFAERFGLVDMRRSAVYRYRAVDGKRKAWSAFGPAGINAKF